MATAEFLDATRMLAVEAATVVDGDVVGDDLILTKHDGSTINAGNVRGATGVPGVNATAGARWSNSTAYSVGNTVGFAGRVWACIQANTGKPPNFWTGYWQPVNGASVDAWAQFDPYFFGDATTEWETFWTTGTVSRSYSTTAGEFETGEKSLKINLAVSSTQRLYEKAYNLVQGGEKVRITARVKLQAAAAGVTCNAELLQAPSTGSPVPFGSGSSAAGSDIGAQTLTTSWQTLTFTMTALNGKPQATANVIISTGSGATAVVLVDSIKVTRGSSVVSSQRIDLTEFRLDVLDGVAKGTELGVVDLNTITSTGIYFQTTTAEATSGTNYPEPHAGVLEVMNNGLISGGVMVWQKYTPYGQYATGFYSRAWYNVTGWTPWKYEGETNLVITFVSGWGAYGSVFAAPHIIRKGDLCVMPGFIVKRTVATTLNFSSGTEGVIAAAGAIPSSWAPAATESASGCFASATTQTTNPTTLRVNANGSIGVVPYTSGWSFTASGQWIQVPSLSWLAGQ